MGFPLDKIVINNDIINNYDENFAGLSQGIKEATKPEESHTDCPRTDYPLYCIRYHEFEAFIEGNQETGIQPFQRRPCGHQTSFVEFSRDEVTYERGYSKGSGFVTTSEPSAAIPPKERYRHLTPEDDESYGDVDISTALANSDEWNREFPWTKLVHEINRDVFKNVAFRPNQLEAINCLLDGNDTFVVIPTGGGKSLCFQLPAVVDHYMQKNCLTVVIMPLISLIHDQMKRLKNLGIGCRALVGELTWSERKGIYDDISENTESVSILFLTPEGLTTSKNLLDLLHQLDKARRLSRFVLDEVHCVSQWGNDFRPNYGAMGLIKHDFPHLPVCALTATATESVMRDVIKKLRLRNPIIFKSDFNRKNLRYEVIKKDKQSKRAVNGLIELITNRFMDQCGIVYCLSCREAEDVANALSSHVTSCYYHAQINMVTRNRIYHDWIEGRVNVIVATLAFGMGIDKPDVRFVIHFSMPKSLENYFQESGRAGRDGKLSVCVLLYEFHDSQRLLTLTQGVSAQGSQESEQQMVNRKQILSMVNYCEDNITCRRILLLKYFGQDFNAKCDVPCDNCSDTTNKLFTYRDCKEYTSYICQCMLYNRKSQSHFTLNTLHKLLFSRSDNDNPLNGYLRKCGFNPETGMILLKQMLVHQMIMERVVKVNNLAYPLYYIKVNPQFRALSAHLTRVKIPTKPKESEDSADNKKPTKRKQEKTRGVSTSSNGLSESTTAGSKPAKKPRVPKPPKEKVPKVKAPKVPKEKVQKEKPKPVKVKKAATKKTTPSTNTNKGVKKTKTPKAETKPRAKATKKQAKSQSDV
ncbi:ATP-dependent DNA helicase, RecQ family member protein [Theileria equi strain WA]|uniref:ATP-dependent DNA helicase n=1 Tax=Theileria equi strain WA TaxID=1537102 RepID=L0AX13_THEEQ|nr:ATP-dependent DNA helicase, RecQ family member protein [Theileria equi strain WA]AFZ79414.1 ATP-dependent DNA helicase, RecQ family member protein [Theileria equi strain WA]|eukprot:XP_004829080.1 ATP-dependent DNA helicase, RecQ family member protein [Theileria equi strain WA]